MITEKDKSKQSKEKLENGIRLCEEAISKAEKYERLKDNKDWQAFLDDLKVLVDLHDREIRMAISMIQDAPQTGHVKKDGFGNDIYVSSKQDWVDYIQRHHIQKSESENWIKEPERILTFASMARERLPILKDHLVELHASENGKS